jgi:putative PIN family toxin of toxin-antitoxin system
MTAWRRNKASKGHARGEARVVLDTNVVLSALFFGRGTTALLRVAWQRREFLPLVSTATVQELIRVLAYPKFKLAPSDQQELLADYLPYTEVVTVPESPPVVPACRDAGDVPFLHLADAGGADILVSGDGGLQALVGQVGYRILTPEAFLAALDAKRALKP